MDDSNINNSYVVNNTLSNNKVKNQINDDPFAMSEGLVDTDNNSEKSLTN